MRHHLRITIAFLVLASTCVAQFVPCKVSKISDVGRRDGVDELRLSFLETSGEVGGHVFVPDSDAPVPAIIFSHSAIQGTNGRADLLKFARALARAGASSIVLEGTIEWKTPNDDSKRLPHLMACAGQWLLLNAKVDLQRRAIAGPLGDWGGGATPFCQPGESPCWQGSLWLGFGQTSDAEFRNTETILTPEGQLQMAQFAQRHLALKEIKPEWLKAEPNQGMKVAR